MRHLYPSLASLLCVHLILASTCLAQQVGAPRAESTEPAPGALKVLALEGQRANNDTRRHIAVQPVVEVRDANDRPIEGATVVFRLPPSGPGGFFPQQKLTLSMKTNVQGQAGATGFVPNDLQGSFEIHVTATAGTRIGEATITETNSLTQLSLSRAPTPKKPFWRNKYVIIGTAAAVTTALVVVLTRSSSTPKSPTVTITPGPVTIGQ